uniref:SMODS and SLOG-associating 2TM effector domain-containing protein n=1 Tax=viral metagenome TaxID=1070528 RepID=A0A6C0E8Q5_9ZZZZ
MPSYIDEDEIENVKKNDVHELDKHENDKNENDKNDKKRLDEFKESSDNISTNASGPTHHIDWSPENELIMVEWCDVAQCYKWLNARAHTKYSLMNAWFTIPAIVLSTISGTASFAQTSLPVAYQVYSPMAIGAINIFIGILTTVQQYLKIAELNEAHRVSSISWDKFARNIRIELAKKPDERMDAGHFLKLNRQEFDRLMETSPMVHEDIIKEFSRKFQGAPGSIERKNFEELRKPDICNSITSANQTRHPWYLELNKSIDVFDNTAMDEEVLKSKDNLIKMQQRRINENEAELKQKKYLEMEQEKRQKEFDEMLERQKKEVENKYKENVDKINNYINDFENIYSRKPLKDELFESMKVIVPKFDLDQYIDTVYNDKNNIENV